MIDARGSNKAVIDGVIQHVSASQIKTFQRCERKWWFEKIALLRPESTGAQNLGTLIHGQLERYYLEGTLPAHGSALKALEALPPRAPEILVEQELKNPYLDIDGVKFKGFVDLLVPGDELRVIDFKTTSSYRYAKTEEELRRDVQMGAYGFWAHQRFPTAKTLKLAHVYLLTRKDTKGSFRIVEVEAKWKDVYRVWGDIVTSIYQMKDAALAPSAEHLEPNWEACEDFGGCPYFNRCHSIAQALNSWEPNDEPTLPRDNCKE